MSAITSASSPAIETFEDELDSHVAESMRDPEFRDASMDVDHRVDLVESLVALRKSLGLTQKDVAKRMGVKQPTVSGFETEGSDPRLSTVQRYARAVEARCVVTVQVTKQCHWVKPTARYEESAASRNSTRVDFSGPSEQIRAWVQRSGFGLAA